MIRTRSRRPAHLAAARPAWMDPPPPAADVRGALLVAALAWVLIVFNIVPEGFSYGATEGMPTRGSALSRAIWLAILSLSSLIIVWRNSLARILLRAINPFFLALFLLALCSVAWSIDPAVTIRRIVRLLAIVSFAFSLVLVAWHPRRFQQVLRPVLAVMLLGSLVFGLAAPGLAIHDASDPGLAGAWRGLATHKNGLGSLASLGTIFWFHALLTREVRPSVAIAGTLLAAILLALSRSSTSIVATAFTVVMLVLVLRAPSGMRRMMSVVVVGFTAIILLYSLVVLQVVPGLMTLLLPITAITGKDLTFTGRTEIWSIIRERIDEHPVLGGGFGAYWVGEQPGSQSWEFLERMYFYPGQAHNGYLDVLNDLGAVGLILLLAYLAAFVWQGLSLLKLDRNQGALYLALIFQQLVSNLSESRWWNVLSVEFVVVTLATAALARDLLESRLRAVLAAGQVRSESPRRP